MFDPSIYPLVSWKTYPNSGRSDMDSVILEHPPVTLGRKLVPRRLLVLHILVALQ